MKKFLLSSVILLITGSSILYAQETIPASGGEATGPGGTSSYTVGQIVYTTNSGTNGSVSNGVQQPYEISVVSVNQVDLSVDLLVYPNPANKFIKLQINKFDVDNTEYQLYDLAGKLIESKKIASSETEIKMLELPSATYFLKVFAGEKEIKAFKIIKN